jgi:TolA-binding protein
VKLARNYDKMRMRAKAIEILKSAIKKYPDTDAAVTAKKLLKSMK